MYEVIIAWPPWNVKKIQGRELPLSARFVFYGKRKNVGKKLTFRCLQKNIPALSSRDIVHFEK